MPMLATLLDKKHNNSRKLEIFVAGYQFEGSTEPAVNVLSSRYATQAIRQIFSDDGRVIAERDFWIAIMEEQAALGLPISADSIDDYRSVRTDIDHESMRAREAVSHHDVNARLEEFNELAGHQDAQKGMTSRDLTENVEQLQIRSALEIIRFRSLSTLSRFAIRGAEHSLLPMAGRSHNVAAQAIVLGKRFSNFGEELLHSHTRLDDLLRDYPLRGVKGPVGTQQDMLDLFEGDPDKVMELERRIAARLGFTRIMGSVGQVYPRSYDLEVITALQQAAAGPANIALNIRLMAGYELGTEGFEPGRVGSNAMPHKMNASRSERIYSLHALLAGHTAVASQLSGHQWNEGDVSDSAARRVIIPDAFYATDGIFETTMHILDGFGAYPAIINRELERYLPFLTTTKALMAAVKAGMGREDAHRIIKKHAVAVALEMREQGTIENDLFDRLANDPDLPVTKDQLEDAISNPIDLTGLAEEQVVSFVHQVEELLSDKPEAVSYKPEKIL